MKITERCYSNTKLFAELEIGEVFQDGEKDILMKIKPFGCDDQTNCISLKNGEGFSYSGYYKVTPITDVELIVG